MNNKTKLSLLGWIIAIIVAIITALYFSSIIFIPKNATTFDDGYVSVTIIILMASGLYFGFKNWIGASQGTYSILQKQLHVTHIVTLTMTITIAIISNHFMKIDSDTFKLLLESATLFAIIETAQILAMIDWDDFKYKNPIGKLVQKIKAKLITTETDDKIKVK